MSKQTLRGLAKDYAKGVIGKDIYRKSRTDLIMAIVGGKIAVKDIDYEGPLKPSNELEEAITEGIQRDKTEITSPKQKTKAHNVSPPVTQSAGTIKNKKKSPFIFIIVSITIVLSLIMAVIIFYPKPPAPSLVDSSDNLIEPESSPDLIDDTTTNYTAAAETLVGDFLKEKNWSEESLDKFIASWSALTQEERDSAIDTKRMQRMKASIYKQFLEGKALASIDSEKARMKQQKLIDFANAIGVDDPRLVLE